MKPTKIVPLHSPLPCQVSQRALAAVQPGMVGSAAVALRWTDTDPGGAYDWRAVPLREAFGAGTDWAGVTATVSGDERAATVTVPAGGWYRLELRRPGAAHLTATVEPVGVGEVFAIAGQSYADNCSDEKLTVQEPQGRVTVLDPATGTWRKADDPQPTPSIYRDGSIWPAFGDELVPRLRVPVGLVNVAIGATSSAQWLPGQPAYENLIAAAERVGRFRAVLWQQGESDVIARTSQAQYIANLKLIRESMVQELGFAPVWLPAKSTLHPTVYNEPTQEQAIRTATEELWQVPGFCPGPDTDALQGEYRGGPATKRHWSPRGQRASAGAWVEAVLRLLAQPER